MSHQHRYLHWKNLYAATAVLLLLGACAPAIPTTSGVDELVDPDPPHAPLATVKSETDCRAGPSTEYPVQDTLKAGEILEIQGRDQDGDAWVVFDPDLGGNCWVEAIRVDVAGDLSLVEIIDPTPPSKPSATVKSETACYTGPGNGYDLFGELVPDISYPIVGIDDDITWFQIDLTALIDPTPPHAPVDELSPQPDPPGSVRRLRCWVPGSEVDLSGDLSGVPIVEMPVVEFLGSAPCLPGAAEGGQGDPERVLEAGAFFRVLGVSDNFVLIDDDITWNQIDDDITWSQIDDDITWFQIDPTTIMDPSPPHRPLNESSGQPEMVERCWVPGDSGNLSGDLSQVPVIPIPVSLLQAQGLIDMPDRSPVEVEAVCSSVLEDEPAVRVSHTLPVPGDPFINVDGASLFLCHDPEAGVKECLPLRGYIGSVHTVRTCYPGEMCEARTVTVPDCLGTGIAEVVSACSSVFVGAPAVRVSGAPASIEVVRISRSSVPFIICYHLAPGAKECLPFGGEAGSDATVTTCLPGEPCVTWPVTVPDCLSRAEVEVAPMCDRGYPAVQFAYTPVTLEPPRVRAEGGILGLCHIIERGVFQCLPLPGETGSTASGTVCFAGEPCYTWSVPVLDCFEEAATANVRQNAVCRDGPTKEYPILAYFDAGTVLKIVGKNQQGTSWVVENPSTGGQCWIAGNLVDVTGDLTQVSIINPGLPPTPTPKPEEHSPFNCSQFTLVSDCIANPACYWSPSQKCENKP
jgi:uncharacterized protein YraI